jgi:hypothetical protein
LASLGMAAFVAYAALKAAFHLMVNAGAGAGAGRHYTVRPGRRPRASLHLRGRGVGKAGAYQNSLARVEKTV